MTWNTILAPLVWILNGLLVLMYLLAEHWAAVLIIPVMGWLALRGPLEHRTWGIGITILAILTAVFAPMPIPVLLLVMAASACIAFKIEKFNPASLHWRSISGIALYALIGVGISMFQAYVKSASASGNALFAQGEVYINIMAAVATYGFPLGFLAMMAQGLLVHPPIPGNQAPADLIKTLRARGRE